MSEKKTSISTTATIPLIKMSNTEQKKENKVNKHYWVSFDGELLFHNDCRPISIDCTFIGFRDTNDVAEYICKNKELRLQLFNPYYDEDKDEEDQLIGNEDFTPESLLKYLEDSYRNIGAFSIIDSEETTFKILSRHKNLVEASSAHTIYKNDVIEEE
jgi:hypothetical protein